ncbi:sialate O-acetylesterase [Formosa sp. PL04]|uniref:sialate O-acetylesterase n=1 Tax=Formosa sp. PL04 TaxID=3081755 RepID=UPI00298299AF|nr:sialate O-acetylesterase [Formosa sp. PL04]MDW5288284.1 sialate O-acetylesterase [Formosa sp. PL04]
MKTHYNSLSLKKCWLILAVIFLSFPEYILADVRLNAIFSDHMVIQRETVIPIWGWADANEIITIETSWGASAQVITNLDGTWRADLETPEAGGPHKITVFSKNKIEINDVLSGDVWLCTGQSNMDFAMNKFVGDSREPQYQPLVEYIRNEVATANDDWIRHIEVPQSTSLFEKKTDFEDSWRSVNPDQIGEISATGYFFAKELRKHVNIPIGLLECSWGGTRIQPWISEETYLADENMKAYFEASKAEAKEISDVYTVENFIDTTFQKKIDAWEKSGKKTKKPYRKVHPEKDHQMPATLHNGMLSAIVLYGIKGFLWYQGESNSHFLEEEYEDYFTVLINSWREEWGQGNLPFYWMQLAGYEVPDERSDNGWAMVNNQLRRTLKVPNTGMAVLYDIGEAKDVHPHNKMDAGKRLALWALQNDYNIKVDAVSGPLYKSITIKGKKAEVTFNEVGSGLMVGHKNLLDATVEVKEPLKWFEIKSADGTWKPAKAKIKSNNTIEVWGKGVKYPTAVRYAWSANPEGANLYNIEGLPAAVFSTED